MEENVKTSVKIAGRIYPLFVHKDEMTKVQQLEHMINETYNGIQIEYAISDKFDCLAMTMLTILSQNGNQASVQNDKELFNVLEDIDTSLQKALQN